MQWLRSLVQCLIEIVFGNIPNLRVKAFNISLLTMIFPVRFLLMIFTNLKMFPSSPSVLSVNYEHVFDQMLFLHHSIEICFLPYDANVVKYTNI